MPYVRRSADGPIESLHRAPSPGAQEFLDAGHPEVAAFLAEAGPEHAGFTRLDADFVRVIEDVIDTLIVKNVINITDLPMPAQAKLLARNSFRERISRGSLRPLADDDDPADNEDTHA